MAAALNLQYDPSCQRASTLLDALEEGTLLIERIESALETGTVA